MKKWYAAHALLYLRVNDGAQDLFPVMENVYVVAAESHEEAGRIAELIEQPAQQNPDRTLTLDGRPATWVFRGIRKTVLCAEADKQPAHGDEVTYCEFQVATRDDVERLFKGEQVTVDLDAAK